MVDNLVGAEWFHSGEGDRYPPTAFKATCSGRSAEPTIALLSEYDALPMGHACGHNIIGTASAAAGIALSEIIKQLPGRVVVLGTPGEEGGGGKILMLERGAFAGVDAAMMIHPGDQNKTSEKLLAVRRIEVEITGKAAHAAGEPEKGINALDALVASYVNISLLRQHIRSDARIHGIITKGGDASNIVPAFAAGVFGVRAADNQYLDELIEKVLACFKAGAQATGASFNYRFVCLSYASMRSNVTMERAFAQNVRDLGLDITGDNNPQKAVGSSDIGNVSQVMPSIQPWMAIVDGAGPHTTEFLSAAVSERGHTALLNAAKALATTAIDLMMDAELLSNVKAEFEGR